MSKLSIVDLDQANELSSCSMAEISGGVGCLQALGIANEIRKAGEVCKNLGFDEAAAYCNGKAVGFASGACGIA
jgi:hypothetical protein